MSHLSKTCIKCYLNSFHFVLIQVETPVSPRCPLLSIHWVMIARPHSGHLIVPRNALSHEIAGQSTSLREVPVPCYSIKLPYLAACWHPIQSLLNITTEVRYSTSQMEKKMFELTLYLKGDVRPFCSFIRGLKCKQFLNWPISVQN